MMTQMEKLVQQQHDMELMKAAMLKQEDTFRQQLHDLHRLYRVQKQLMSDQIRCPWTVMLPCQQGQRRRQQPRPSELNLQLPFDEYGGAITGPQVTPLSRWSEDELELTLAVSAGNRGSSRSRRKPQESTSTTDTDGSLQQTTSSSTDSNGTLHRRATACELREGMLAKQPQWLAQCLSLRMA